ncbi:hypothetical protein, partial [Streptomyces sp. MBT55]|uniref:hypothetical protein n=1 Tax=Streptomyces sp. MBT55 TaxID=1488386 RepID=UPI001913D3AF
MSSFTSPRTFLIAASSPVRAASTAVVIQVATAPIAEAGTPRQVTSRGVPASAMGAVATWITTAVDAARTG